jgi:hypothetical protein
MVGSHMVKVEDMDTVEEHHHPMNHRPKVAGMDTVEEHYHPMNNRPKVAGMDTVEEHYHPTNNRPEVAGMDTLEEHYHPMNHRVELEGMDREDSGMVEVVGREPKGMVLVRHWTGDGAARHQRTHREWEELAKSGCSKGLPTSANRDSNCCSP